MQHLKVRCVTQKKEENNNNFRDMCRKCLFLDIKTIKTLLSGLLRSHNNVISVKRNVIQALSVQSLHVLRTKYQLIVRKIKEALRSIMITYSHCTIPICTKNAFCKESSLMAKKRNSDF